MSTSLSAAFPAYTIFHASLGYIIIVVGLVAIISRIVVMCLKDEVKRDKWRRVHRLSGRAWLMSVYLMPITAIYIKPRDLDWDIVAFFIFSMYITIIIGFSLIKIREVVTGTRTKQVLKWAHAAFMVYSWAMLVGAGVSFPSRAIDRINRRS